MSTKSNKDRLKAARRKLRIKHLTRQPVIKKVDVEEIKAAFGKKLGSGRSEKNEKK